MKGSWERLGPSPVGLGSVETHLKKHQKTTGFTVFLGAQPQKKTGKSRLESV